MAKLQPKQKAFATNVVQNGGDKVKARTDAGYSTKMSIGHQRIDADKLFNHANISLMIADLQKEADKIAKAKFTISIERRLEWLNEVALAGLETYSDQQGNQRRENLSATSGAIKVMNEMLGVGGDDNDTGESISINFNISEPVGKVKVTRGE